MTEIIKICIEFTKNLVHKDTVREEWLDKEMSNQNMPQSFVDL